MKENREILNESLFKKETYEEKLKKSLPGYEPVSSKPSNVFGTHKNNDSGIFAVNDVGEMKKLLTKTYGAAFGDNNIKAMAGRAIKTFPIIISDNVEPETALAIKKLVEEQYADYINLLVSNKVIDIGAFSTAEPDGSNIAIQALDTLSGNDFSKNRVANKAMMTGELTADDIFTNVPLFQIMRENAMELKTGDALFDSLLENAVVVPESETNKLAKYITENADGIADIINEATSVEYDTKTYREEDPSTYQRHNNRRKVSIEDAIAPYMPDGSSKAASYNNATYAINSRDKTMNALLGFQGVNSDGKQIYNKLTNAEVIVDKGQFDSVMNRTIGEVLMDPKNAALKDRFEKASILLQSEMITGSEFIDYCTMRLGIPMSQYVRSQLSTRFRKAKSMDRHGNYKNDVFMTNRELKAIKKNKKIFEEIAPKIFGVKIKTIVGGAGAAAVGAGVATGAGVAAGVAAGVSAIFAWPLLLTAVAGAATGVGAYALFKKLKNRKTNKVEGWERVELLIDMMDKQRADVISKVNLNINTGRTDSTISKNVYDVVHDNSALKGGISSIKRYEKDMSNLSGEGDDEQKLTADQLDMIQKEVKKQIEASLTLAESVNYTFGTVSSIDINRGNSEINDFVSLYEEEMKDPTFRAQALEESLILSEKSLKTAVPMKVQYVEKKPNKDVLITPQFSARSNYAYGSTEIDPKAIKDRKYNQPLLMTVKFKQRFDDGHFSDNELTAVIGILGKVIRVPSEEMKYILESNANGKSTESGLFKNIDVKNMAAELLDVSKINKDIKALPKSADVWKNLEKVADLAVANTMAGKKTGNVANAHIIFSQNEIDAVRVEDGLDYRRDMKLTEKLMKRYSAFALMIADDPAQRLYVYNGVDDISWNVVPYSSIFGKDSSDQLVSALARLGK